MTAINPETIEPETMERLSRPWRLSVIGAGIGLGLLTRLLASNGIGDLANRPMALAAAATSALVGIGLLFIAAERDRFGSPMTWIVAATAGGWGVLNWVSPPFVDDIGFWDNGQQSVLALVGVGNGILLAGIVALAFVRRFPTVTVAAVLFAGVLTLGANSVLLRIEWPAIAALTLGFGLVLLGWDQSPRKEIRFVNPVESPRISRAALSLASVAFCGTALQIWLSRRPDIPRSLVAVFVALLLIAAAFASMMRVRREIERRETTLSEWTSWMREIRTKDFRSDLENFDSGEVSEDERQAALAALEAEPPRPVSFPNLAMAADPPPARAEDALAGFDAADLATAAAELGVPDRPASDTPVAPVPPPDIFVPTADASPTAAALDLPDELPLLERPIPEVPPAQSPADQTPPAETAAPPPVTTLPTADVAPQVSAPSPVAPSPRVEVTVPRVRIPQAALPIADQPGVTRPGAAQPSVGDAPPPNLVLPVADTPAASPASSTGSGAFSRQLTTQSPPVTDVAEPARPAAQHPPASQQPPAIGDIGSLEHWLSEGAANRPAPLLVAVESMPLARFEQLPPEEQLVTRRAVTNLLAEVLPKAELISWIDGPYFIVTHNNVANSELGSINKVVLARLQGNITLDSGPLPLHGTLALLRPSPDISLDGIVNEAVIGLVQARQIEAATR